MQLIILLIQIPINVWEEIGWRGFLAIVLVAVYRGKNLSRGERHTVVSESVPVGIQER